MSQGLAYLHLRRYVSVVLMPHEGVVGSDRTRHCIHQVSNIV